MSRSAFMIAGESSGDVLGGRLIQALRECAPDIAFDGIGGPMMQAQGLKSRLPMENLCVMGLIEIVRQLPRLLNLIDQVAHMVEEAQPDVLVTIDLPDFNFRVAKKLRQRGIYKGKIVHYVAPTVWAWRPGRAKKIAQFLDGLICLFPMEPLYFQRHGLRTLFAGHPLVEDAVAPDAGSTFRKAHGLQHDDRVLGLFFGSRHSELTRVGVVLAQAAYAVRIANKEIKFVAPTVPHLKSAVMELLQKCQIDAIVMDDPAQKPGAFRACDAALAVSGTVGLELAYAGVPHAIAYKANSLTWFVFRRLVRVKYAHLANILLDAPVVPEFLQERCDPALIAHQAHDLLNLDLTAQNFYKKNFAQLGSLLQPHTGQRPSTAAAEFVFSFMP
ncbi:MAG: lipid-A-disaccharide synthase [Alphaproteobacteria bacterium]|nr:lipid-A-disaccharide synthase [Alphaproteobacteria bacterium]